MLRVRNLGMGRVEALGPEPALEPESDPGFSPLGRSHAFQSQLHQLTDAALIAAALVASYELRRRIGGHFTLSAPLRRYVWSYVVVLPVAMYFLNQVGLYKNTGVSALRLLWNVGRSMAVAMIAAVGVAYMFKDQIISVSRIWVLLFAATSTALIVSKHVGWRLYAYRNGMRAAHRRTVALLGAREQNREIAERIARHPEWGITVAAELDLNQYSDERLVEALHEHHVECVMLTTGRFSFERIGQAITVCETEGVDVWLMADFVKPAIARIAFDQFDRRPVLLFNCKPDCAWHLLFKRALDFVGAAVVLLIVGPLVMLPVAIAIKLTSKGPIFFRQQRVRAARQDRSHMLKFRSMVANAEALQANLIAHNEQSGPVFKMQPRSACHALGRFIRKYQHRRAAAAYQRAARRHEPRRPTPADAVRGREVRGLAAPPPHVRPGLTCIWQVSGRNRIGFEEWMCLDLAYIDSWSLRLDFQILLNTLPAVIAGDGAS